MNWKTVSHYKIIEKTGEDSFGVVYRARDTQLDRFVAVKFLPPNLASDADARQRFFNGTKAAASLFHPNICPVYETGEADGIPFLVMAFLEGQTVKDKVKDGPLEIDEAVDIAIQAARGLAVVHKSDLVHRDIKSSNILVDQEGHVMLTDFGVAQRAHQPSDGRIVGTFGYMSPEVWAALPADRRSDTWSLGAVLYEMVTGQLPFAGDFDQVVAYSNMSEELEPLTSLRADTPPALESIVGRALAKDPNQRYQNVEEMIADLEAIRELKPKSVEPPGEEAWSSVIGTSEAETESLISREAILVRQSLSASSVIAVVTLLSIWLIGPPLFWIPIMTGSLAVAGSNVIHLNRLGEL